jgi:integrase
MVISVKSCKCEFMPRAPRFTDANIIAEAKRIVAEAKKAEANGTKVKRTSRLFVGDTSGLYLATKLDRKGRIKQRWIFRFSRPDKSGPTERTLGPYRSISLEMAKNAVARARLMMERDKLDPWKVDSDLGPQKTFGEVAKLWIETNKSSWKTAKQRRNTELLLLVHGKSLLEMPILKIKPSHIHDALRPLWDRTPYQVRRALAKMQSVFDYAKVHRWFHGDNPARWRGTIEHLFPRLPKSQREHYAEMDYEEVPQFIRALRQRQDRSVAAVALEFCILTATRSSETLGMRWSEIGYDFENENRIPKHFENRDWTMPGKRMKKGREYVVPLSDRAIEILRRRKEHALSDYVFFGYQRDKALDDKSMRLVLHKMGVKATVHGMRSSFRDWAGDETDYARETIEECLSHLVGNTTEQAYRRRTSLEKRRALMAEWAAYCCSLCG